MKRTFVPAIPGFVKASILRRSVTARTEFQIVTVWQSPDAILGFSGPDAEVAVVPPVVREMMVEFEPRATHYESGKSTAETRR